MIEPRSLDALQTWLVGPEVVDVDGAVWSWRGVPDGFHYPEAAGLWLSWIAAVAPMHPRSTSVATRLERAIEHGEVGRDRVGYAFDLGVALCGLLRLARARDESPSAICHQGASRLVTAIVERRAVTSGVAPDRWSASFGSHQRKLAVTLDHIEDVDLVDTHAARASLWTATGADRLDVTQPEAEPVYVHAAAYALEGSWAMGAMDTLARGASWLAEIQRTDGGVPASWDRRAGGHGPARADATAQAIRLWCASDRRRWASAIDRGLGFLGTLVDPQGGVRYGDDCEHRNVWCSLFAVQAAQFAEQGAELEALL